MSIFIHHRNLRKLIMRNQQLLIVFQEIPNSKSIHFQGPNSFVLGQRLTLIFGSFLVPLGAAGRIYYTKPGVPLVTTMRIVASCFDEWSRESSPTSCWPTCGEIDIFSNVLPPINCSAVLSWGLLHCRMGHVFDFCCGTMSLCWMQMALDDFDRDFENERNPCLLPLQVRRKLRTLDLLDDT